MSNDFNITQESFAKTISNIIDIDDEKWWNDETAIYEYDWHSLHIESMAKCFAEFAGSPDDHYILRGAWSIFQKTGGYNF